MLRNKHCFCFFLFLLICGVTNGQNGEQYSFTHYRLSDGLASNIVNNVVQDSIGFIWLSTNNGLQRFDGNKFITFKSKSGQAGMLPSDEINHLYKDRKSNLWVLTADNKVGLFNTQTFQYKEVALTPLPTEKVYVDKLFIETEDGKLLLHTRKTNRLAQFDAKVKAFVPSKAIPFPKDWTITDILQSKTERKYFLAGDSGFAVYNQKTGHLNYRGHNPDGELLIREFQHLHFINHLFIDSKSNFYFEQWPKTARHPVLHVLNMVNGEKKQHRFQDEYGLGYHQIKEVVEQKNGRLWLYGLPFLAEYVTSSQTLRFLKKDYNKEKNLKFNQVHSLYEDGQHNMWICTDNGLYLFNPDAQFFHNYTLTTPGRFAVEGRSQTALEFQNGELWVGYRDLGLHRYDKQLQEMPLPESVVPLQNGRSIWDLHLHTKTGKVWITMQGGSLIVYDTLTHKAQLFTPPSFEQRAITQVTEDKKGNLWFGTQAGNVVKWDLAKGAANIMDGFSLVRKTGIIEKLFTDRNGAIWIAAVGSGLLVLDPSNGQVVHKIGRDGPDGYRLWDNNPKDIVQYNDSTLVVASGALNLVNTSTYRVQQVSNADGLPTNTVQSLAKDAAGMLWLGTMNGLCVADLNKLSFTVYNQSDGLLNDHFNVAGAHMLHNGKILFTSAESFLIFDPSQTRQRNNTNRLLITDFWLLNQSLPVDSLLAQNQINLPHNKTYVAIEFSALNYNKLNKLEYWYQLEGLDTTWTKSDDRHLAVYTFLPPDKYTFKLRTKNVDGLWNLNEVRLTLVVSPPFYKTWWFFVALLIVTGTVLYLLYRERIKRLVTLHNIRSDIASHLHQDVSTTLNNINVLSQIAKLKADRDIDRSKELIDEISGKSYNMMVSMDEILWSIDPNNDTMEKTILRMVEFFRTLEASYSTSIDIVVHEKVKDLRLDMKVRHDFFIICKAAMQHMAQHSKGKIIMIDIDLAWSKIIIKILNKGTGMDEDTMAMAELKKNMEEKAAAMHANLVFEVGKRDTSIILSIPVKPNALEPYTIFSSRR